MRSGLLWAAALLSVVSAKAQYPDDFPVSTRVRRDVNMQHGCNKCLYFPGRLRVCIYFPCTPPHADVKNCVWCKQFGPHKVCVQYTCLTNINGGKECTPGSSYLHRCNICTCGKKPNDAESTCSNNFCRGDVPAYPEVESGLQRGQSLVRDESATFTWSETAGSLLKVNIRILFFCGAWPLSESALAYAYVSAVLLASLANMAEAALGIAFGQASMDEVTLVLPNTLTTACGVAKLAFFLSDRRRYFALVRRADRLAAPQEGLAAGAAEAVGRRVRAFALFLVALVCVQAVVWFPMPLIASPGERKLPFGQLPWSNYTQVPLYELSYALQCVSSFTIANITLGFDCLFMGIMELTALQLDLLSSRLSSLRLDEAACSSEKSRGRGCVAQTAKARDAAHRELCLCIERHQDIIRFTRHLEEMMSPIAMTQFMFSVLSVCLLLFQATYSDDFSAVFRCVAFLPLPGGQMYIYCWAAHRITQKAEALSVAAYSCQWVEASRRFKRSLAIVIFRAQQQLVITAGHLYPVNRTTFVSLVNASYSYYALLGQINKR